MPDYFITKHALTDGIVKLWIPVEPTEDGYLSYIQNEPRWQHHFYAKKDWHRTHEEAASRAEKMRAAKIASAKKQIDRLEKLSFAEPAPCK